MMAVGAVVLDSCAPSGTEEGADPNGLVLLSGFTSRVIARANEPVADTGFVFRGFPDGAATFVDHEVPGGWYLAVNHEHFAFGEGMGAMIGPASPQPDVLNYSWREYGNRVGVWRLMEVFDRFQLPVTVSLSMAVLDMYPDVAEAMRRIQLHGEDYRTHWQFLIDATKIADWIVSILEPKDAKC